VTVSRPIADIVALAGFLAVCLGVSAIGGAITATSVDTWYPTLAKPPFNPPDWVFAPVWISLYIMMAVAAWRAWRVSRGSARTAGMVLFAVQLVLNLTWSLLFFGFQQTGAALVEMIVLLAAIVANMTVFARMDRAAGWLFVPYVLWVAYALLLNASIWMLN
jgi:tryptophan-rich sensory protein